MACSGDNWSKVSAERFPAVDRLLPLQSRVCLEGGRDGDQTTTLASLPAEKKFIAILANDDLKKNSPT